MEEKVSVADLVKAALGVQKADMPLQFFGVFEGIRQLVDDVVFLGSQLVGVGGIHRGEVAVQHGVDFAVQVDGLVLIVDFVQQQPVLHAKFRTAQHLLALQLEEDNGDGFVHPGGEQLVLFRVLIGVGAGELDLELVGVGIPVDLIGEDGQGPQGDAVARLNHVQIVVADGVRKHRGNQRPGAGGRAHPEHIVVAPLDVHIIAGHQAVHDDVRPGAPVKNVAHNVQLIHHQRLDHLADGPDHVGGLPDLDDGADDVLVLIPAGAALLYEVNQLVENLLVVRVHVGSDLCPGVLGGHEPAQVYQSVDGEPIPLIQIFFLVGHQRQLGGGVVDEGGQVVTVPLSHGISEQLLQLFLDFAGAGVQNVQKRLMLAVDVGHEVLRGLREVQNGLEPDDFRARGFHGGVLPGQ